MKETDIEVLRQIVSRTDKTGNEKVEMLVEFVEKQLKNCNLPHVSNLVCPTHGTMLYKHPNGLAYCSLCNYSISWQTCC